MTDRRGDNRLLGDILQDALRNRPEWEDPRYFAFDADEDSMYPHLTRKQLERMVKLLVQERRPSDRVMEGFLRAAVAFACLPIIAAVAQFVIYLVNDWTFTLKDMLIVGGLYATAAAIIFAVFGAFGWILSGFFK